MKKFFAVMLALCLSLCMFTACGGDSTESTAPANTATDVVIPSDSGDGNEAGEEQPEETESDMAYVQDKGTLVVGVTNFAPMDYLDENGEWIGFDAELAEAFAESLGVTAEFVEISWDNKIIELDSYNIDVVWNGMTLTDDEKNAMECSEPYCNNAQIVIVPADVADQYQTEESLAGLSFAVESGSAGQKVAEEKGFSFTPVPSQAGALLEVSSGISQAAIIDSLMAAAMVGEGTDYDTLTYTIGLTTEEYGVGFRKGSDLAAELDSFLDAAYADGSMLEIAEKYGVQAAIVER